MTFDILALLDTKAKQNTGYDRLAGKLGSDDAIISLNYDTLLDSALVRRGWNPKAGYRLGGGSRKVEWAPNHSDENGRTPRVSLLKLHGSINWFVRGSYATLSKVFASKPVRVTGPRRNEITAISVRSSRRFMERYLSMAIGESCGLRRFKNCLPQKC